MFPVELRFHGDLDGFLPKEARGRRFLRRTLREKTSVKDLIEACGVPHPEVDLIVRLDPGGSAVESLDFTRPIDHPTRLAVHPVPAPGELLPSAPRLQFLGHTRFVADVHLGATVRHLRLLGLDVAYEVDASDPRLLEIMLGEGRALLTRDRRLLMHAIVRHGYAPRSDRPEEQAREILHRFRPAKLAPWTRCLACNGLLARVPKGEVVDELADQPRTLRDHDTFYRCDCCRRVFWRGSHHQKLTDRLARLLPETRST